MAHTFSACPSCHAINRIDTKKVSSALCGKCQKPLSFHGRVSEVNTQDFEKILRVSDRPVVVDFWASWCGPCKVYGPEFERASLASDEVVFLKMNTETETELSGKLAIRGIPCTILFKEGKEVKRQSGAMDSKGILSFLGAS